MNVNLRYPSIRRRAQIVAFFCAFGPAACAFELDDAEGEADTEAIHMNSPSRPPWPGTHHDFVVVYHGSGARYDTIDTSRLRSAELYTSTNVRETKIHRLGSSEDSAVHTLHDRIAEAYRWLRVALGCPRIAYTYEYFIPVERLTEDWLSLHALTIGYVDASKKLRLELGPYDITFAPTGVYDGEAQVHTVTFSVTAVHLLLDDAPLRRYRYASSSAYRDEPLVLDKLFRGAKAPD